jgi:hypothetical protein
MSDPYRDQVVAEVVVTGYGDYSEVLERAEQDHRDGEALRRLREALPAEATIGIEWKLLRFETHGHGEETASFIEVGTERAAGTGATIAEAADACREALG